MLRCCRDGADLDHKSFICSLLRSSGFYESLVRAEKKKKGYLFLAIIEVFFTMTILVTD